MEKRTSSIIFTVLFLATAMFLGIAFIIWTFVPYEQELRYVKSLRRSDGVVWLLDKPNVFAPYTYVQPEIRENFLRQATVAYEEGKIDQPTLLDAIGKLEVVTANNSYFPKYYLSLARAYTALAKKDENKRQAYLERATYYCNEAYALIPESPELSTIYALVLINQEKYDDAIVILKHSIAATPENPDAHFLLGIALFHLGQTHYSGALTEFEIAGSQTSDSVDTSIEPIIYRKLFVYFYQNRDKGRFLTVVQRLKQIDAKRKDLYESMEHYMSGHTAWPRIQIQTEE